MAIYEAAKAENWQGRIDGDTPEYFRWHQVVQLIDLEKGKLPVIGSRHTGIALLGFCCDEGVRRNLGRTGAKEGPDAIRSACKNLPLQGSHFVLVDAGNIICNDEDLEGAQEALGQSVAQLKAANYMPIVLGGGHEVSYGTFLGIEKASGGGCYGAINFDAHFDLREPNENGGNSGTGFYQMYQHCLSAGREFNYLPIGIQQYSNTMRLFDLASQIANRYFLAEQFTNDQLEAILMSINGMVSNCDHLLLSIDLDVFSTCYAPGVSAPSYNGIAANSMFKRLVRHTVFSGKIDAINIAELNPSLDKDDRTAKLAASIIFDMVQAADLNAEYPG